MPEIFIDFPEPDTAQPEAVSGQSVDGASFDTEGFVIPTVVPLDQAQAWLDLYDPASQYSPAAATSREIARTVLGALKAIVEGQDQ